MSSPTPGATNPPAPPTNMDVSRPEQSAPSRYNSEGGGMSQAGGGTTPSASAAVTTTTTNNSTVTQSTVNREQVYTWILELTNPDTREHALIELRYMCIMYILLFCL